MNTRDKTFFLPDIQSQVDARDLRIDAVGVKDVRYPMTIRSHGGSKAGKSQVAAWHSISPSLPVFTGIKK